MIISRFTQPEIDYLLSTCNFTYRERMVFTYRNDGMTLEEIAEKMDYSIDTIKKISREVKRKIIKVL